MQSRYPEAEPLPDRSQNSSRCFERVGLDVRWEPRHTSFPTREATILVTSGSSVAVAASTATATRHVEITPRYGRGHEPFEERLQHAYADGGFLVLTVQPSRMRGCEAELLRRFESGAESRSTICSSTPCGRRPRNWSRLVHHREGRWRRALQPGLEEPAASGRASRSEDRRRT